MFGHEVNSTYDRYDLSSIRTIKPILKHQSRSELLMKDMSTLWLNQTKLLGRTDLETGHTGDVKDRHKATSIFHSPVEGDPGDPLLAEGILRGEKQNKQVRFDTSVQQYIADGLPSYPTEEDESGDDTSDINSDAEFRDAEGASRH